MRLPLRWILTLFATGCLLCLAAVSLSSPASAACTPQVAAPAKGEQGKLLPISYTACVKGSHRFQLIYLSDSTVMREPGSSAGHRTVKVKATGKHTYNWGLGSIARARYRVTMTTPGGERVKSRHTVLIVCSAPRKADPQFGCSAPPAR